MPVLDPSSAREARWVLRAQCGDRAALDALLASVAPPLHRYLFRLTGREDVADDVLQEVLLTVCKKLKHVREPRVFRFWAFRVASRAAFKALRRHRVEVAFDDGLADTVGDPKAAAAIEAGLQRETVERLLDSLSPAARAVLSLHYLDGLSLAEVADVLEIPVGTVKSRLAYGIGALRERGQATR